MIDISNITLEDIKTLEGFNAMNDAIQLLIEWVENNKAEARDMFGTPNTIKENK